MLDQWTPLFQELEEKVSIQGRRQLLFQLIGELYDISVKNYGEIGIDRPRPWKPLGFSYAQEFHGGDLTPKLILSGKMLASFKVSIGINESTLENTAEYSAEQQNSRPFIPITPDGQLTPFAASKLLEVLDSHFQAEPSI